MPPAAEFRNAIPDLCLGREERLRAWLADDGAAPRMRWCLLIILAGCGCYGFTLGLWRSPLMGHYVAVKLPLLVMLTLAANGLINGMLALVLGSGLGFRQTVLAILMSFAVFSLIVGSLSPITLFMVLNAPGPDEPNASDLHTNYLLIHTAIIAFAGIMANARLFPLLLGATGKKDVALRVFLVWLAGNLFVGGQLSWNLRPFFGTPGRPVQFLREDWNRSSFYENIWMHLTRTFAAEYEIQPTHPPY